MRHGTRGLTWWDPEAALSTVRDLGAVLFPCTASSRTKRGRKAAGMAVGANVQLTEHIHHLQSLTLLR